MFFEQLQGALNKVGSKVTWMLSVLTGQLLKIKIASEQQMINKPRMRSLKRAERDMIDIIIPLVTLLS
jgi:hypothetical protein